MIEQTRQKLFEVARDILDLEDQLDQSDDPRAQGDILLALDSLKEHTRSLYDALVVLRHELSSTHNSDDSPAVEDDQDFQQDTPGDDTPLFEPSTEKIKDIVAQMPPETQQVDELFQGITDGSPEAHEALSHYQEEIEFEAVNPETEVEVSLALEVSEVSEADSFDDVTAETVMAQADVSGLKNDPARDLNSKVQKPRSVNDQWGHFSVGLNDRTAFVQHLFLGDVEGFNRVLSQINTFETLEEVTDFLEHQVKPEYNNWEAKDAVVDRLMRLVQQRFNA
jgi:hypothetical protein